MSVETRFIASASAPVHPEGSNAQEDVFAVLVKNGETARLGEACAEADV